jgi:hypothetical protein
LNLDGSPQAVRIALAAVVLAAGLSLWISKPQAAQLTLNVVESYTSGPPIGGLSTMHGDIETLIYRNSQGDTVTETRQINLPDADADKTFDVDPGPIAQWGATPVFLPGADNAKPSVAGNNFQANNDTFDLIASGLGPTRAVGLSSAVRVPEPMSIVLLGVGLLGLSLIRRKRVQF